MKVLFITHYAWYYGANRSMIYLIDDLKKRYKADIEIFIIGEGDLFQEVEKRNMNYHTISAYSWMIESNRNILFRNRIKSAINKIVNYPKIKKMVKEINPDIIHCNSSLVDVGYKLSRKMKIPCIWHIREFGKLDYDLEYTVSKKNVKNAFESADFIIAISESIGKYLREIAPNARIEMIYNGINCFTFERKRDNQERVIFAVIGRLTEQKNQIDILKATKILFDSGKQNFEIRLYGGKDQAYENQLKTFVRKNNLETLVHFFDYRDNVIEELKSANIGIISSLKEAFGRVTVEYMMAEMPVIGTNTGGTKEIIIDGTTGLLYAPGDYKQLAYYMNMLIDDKEYREKLGKAGRQRAVEHFSLNKNTDKIWNLYQNVLNKELNF